MRPTRLLSLTVFSAAVLTCMMGTATLAASGAPDKLDKSARPQAPADGERAFHENCSRCHTAPQGFSPSISGTILRHMRVRANLSRQDERAILKYLNP